jgi:hypothetical protein
MRWSLTGFEEEAGVRIFRFEGIATDFTRTGFSVRADLALIRRYGIPIQDLPLMCRDLLERRDESEDKRTFTFTEADVCIHAQNHAPKKYASAAKRKPPRSPHVDTSPG